MGMPIRKVNRRPTRRQEQRAYPEQQERQREQVRCSRVVQEQMRLRPAVLAEHRGLRVPPSKHAQS